MTATVLIALSSGRKHGYTAGLWRRAVDGAATVEGVVVDAVQLHDYSFGPCTSCFHCIRHRGNGCVLEDDFGRDGEGVLYRKAARADAVIGVQLRDRRAEAAGRPTDFWGISDYLPSETARYVPKLLALVEIVSDPAQYNLTLPVVADEPQFSVTEIGSQLDLALKELWTTTGMLAGGSGLLALLAGILLSEGALREAEQHLLTARQQAPQVAEIHHRLGEARLAQGHDREAVAKAIERARAEADRPSIIIARSHIGYGSPKQDDASAHGEPLGAEAMAATREKLGWPYEPFHVPGEAAAHHQYVFIFKI